MSTLIIGAGFSNAESTWLLVNPNYWRLNAERQNAEDGSHLKVYKTLVALREKVATSASTTTATIGRWVFAFTRSVYTHRNKFKLQNVLSVSF